MTRVYWIIGFLMVAAAFAAPAWLYLGLPDRIPTHWNIEGKVDGYGGKWTLFLFPALMVGSRGSQPPSKLTAVQADRRPSRLGCETGKSSLFQIQTQSDIYYIRCLANTRYFYTANHPNSIKCLTNT